MTFSTKDLWIIATALNFLIVCGLINDEYRMEAQKLYNIIKENLL